MQTAKGRILYVDEDEERGLVFANYLRIANYSVVTTEFASDALHLAQNERFDLYLLSRRFPIEAGAYLCQRLYSISPETPMIFFSDNSNGDHQQEIIRTGAREFVVEAGDLVDMVSAVERLLSEVKEDKSVTV